MLFYEPVFLIFFLALYSFYIAVAGSASKIYVLLTGSLLFYAWSEPIFVPILLASAGLDYALSRKIASGNRDGLQRFLLAAGVASNLAILFAYKYIGFLIINVNAGLVWLAIPALPAPNLSLPIGVSFVVFEKITFLVDNARGASNPPKRFADYCLFVLFFPKLLAGPILKYHDMEQQIFSPPTFCVRGSLGRFYPVQPRL
jgi:alginate O-acetyltransferase complex protein AlgI